MNARQILKQTYHQAYTKILTNKEHAFLYGIISLIFASFDSSFIFFGLSEHKQPHIAKYSISDWIWLFLKNLVLRFMLGIATILGYICLIIPGLLLHTRWAFVSESLIDNNSSMGQAINNSARLTRRRFLWLRIFALHVLCMFFAPTLCYALLSLVLFFTPGFLFFLSALLSGIAAVAIAFILCPLLFIFHRHVMLELYFLAKQQTNSPEQLLQ